MNYFSLLASNIRSINAQNGWDTPTNFQDTAIAEKIALIHSEASEALEAFREDDFDGFAEELADIIIRTIDLSTGLGIDIEAEIRDKSARNAERGWKHGGKKV